MTRGVAELGDLIEIIAGQHIQADLYGNEPIGTPYLTGPADFGEIHPKITKWTKFPKVFASEGDVLVTVKGAGVGKSNLGCNAAIGRQLMALRPASGKIDQSYLFHYIRAQERNINYLADGATVPGISKEDLRTLKLPNVAIDEQRRIAAILDKADALCRKRKRALDLLDGLTQSIFVDMFGSPENNFRGLEEAKIGDLLAETQYGTASKAGSNGNFPILRMGNITYNGSMDYSDLKYIHIEEKDQSRYTVKKGDILFNRTNSAALVGKTGLFDEDSPMGFAGYLIRLRTNDLCIPEYLHTHLNSNYTKIVLFNMAKNIIGMANINANELRTIPILLPAISDQEEFRDRIGIAKRQKSKSYQAVISAAVLFRSLQSRMFGEELV